MTKTVTHSVRRRLFFDEFENTEESKYDDIDAQLDALNNAILAKKCDKWNFDFFIGEEIGSENIKNDDDNQISWKMVPNKIIKIQTKFDPNNGSLPSTSMLLEKTNTTTDNDLSPKAKLSPNKSVELKQTQIIAYLKSTSLNSNKDIYCYLL
uniref:Cyclin-dependent kinase inhibitor domain-containing protein n=1 Tax=Parastrongyloides trichosuri TaxID=131310 RepID=A0A0N4ZDK6_PARTI